MATTYEAIATVTVGSGGAANIEFTSIPATYTNLVLKLSLRSNRAATFDNTQIEINSSTANMTSRLLTGNGSTASSGNTTTFYVGDIPAASATSNTFANQEVYLPNYAGSSNKSASSDSVAENNATAGFNQLAANLWSQTAAITSLKMYSGNTENFVEYSTATLYGIKNS